MKKTLIVVMMMAMVFGLAGCGGTDEAANPLISIVSREDGSGTRGAFIELFGIEQKDKDGNKVDKESKVICKESSDFDNVKKEISA